jgi:adenosylcobinamide-GDP ribazoletransferase
MLIFDAAERPPVLFCCRRTAYKNFCGYTGDVCGWFQQLCEIWYLTAFVLTKLITGALA